MRLSRLQGTYLAGVDHRRFVWSMYGEQGRACEYLLLAVDQRVLMSVGNPRMTNCSILKPLYHRDRPFQTFNG